MIQLYRIIGVFGDQVKLTKNTSIGQYDWESNTWSESKLNTETLNGTFLNDLGATCSSMISYVYWKVGGNTDANIRNVIVKNAYINEIVSPVANTTYLAN